MWRDLPVAAKPLIGVGTGPNQDVTNPDEVRTFVTGLVVCRALKLAGLKPLPLSESL